MLRPACLPSPPDWLRRRDGTRLSLRLLRTFVIPAFDARCRQPALGIRLDGRTGNLPSSELSPDKSPRLVRLHSFQDGQYLRDGFGPHPAFFGLVAEVDGSVEGYLLNHHGYDTDRG